MKTSILYIIACMVSLAAIGQTTFNSEDYYNFIESNKDLSATELLENYPPKTTYYSSRMYPAELKDIPWFDSIDQRFNLSEDEKNLLSQNHFMVTERLSNYTWIDALSQIYYADLPLFLSTDFFLFTLHQSYDEILKNIEWKVLEPNLKELLRAMYERFPELYLKYASSPELMESLYDVDLYIAVASSLLNEQTILPQKAGSEDYNKVMTAISEEKMTYMPLFTADTLDRKLDFSQFKPRGHYTDEIFTSSGTRTLEAYFRAMMWMGRIDFLMTAPPDNPWEQGWKEGNLLRMNLSALLLNEVLHGCGKKELLDKHEKIIAFMVGPDDNLNPDELEGLRSKNLQSLTELLNAQSFSEFSELLNGSDDFGQKIMSNFFLVDPEASDPGELPVSFKLMGQKFILDSYLFSEVVFDRIVHNGTMVWRALPNPLDMLSVFGNEDAMALMEDEMETYKYAYKINQLKYMVDAYDESFWTQSLYNTWLSALIKLNPPSSSQGLPYFMQTTAWHHEKINTQLTSWAQLRHDNILYAKQSYTGGTGCSYPYTYIEPCPDFYKLLRVFAENAEVFFTDVLQGEDDFLASTIKGYYQGYAEHIGKIEAITLKEISGIPLEDDEMVFLKTMINEYMASGPGISGWINSLLYPAMDMWDSDFTVADVHTQPTDEFGAVVGNVLHVGNGLLNMGVFIAPSTSEPDKNMCYIGPVGSFHTQVKNNFYRLDDDEWKEMFVSANTPERPSWAYAYLADSDGKIKTSDQLLKGAVYTGTATEGEKNAEITYLLAYPNPARETVHFRFILRERSFVNAEVYDLTGRKVSVICRGMMEAAEHELSMSFKESNPGIYFLRLIANGQLQVKRFILE